MVRGHNTKRSEDSWSLVVELERDSTTGKRRQTWSTSKATKRDAETHLADLIVDADRGLLGPSAKTTVSDFLERWLTDYADSNTTAKTALEYRGLIQWHITPHIGRVTVSKLPRSHILRLQTALRTIERGNGRGCLLSSTTRRHAQWVLITALEHAVQWKLISSNPASAVYAPIVAHTEMRTLSPDQSSAFLREAQSESPC